MTVLDPAAREHLRGPVFSDEDLAALNARFEREPAATVISWAVEQFHPFLCLTASMNDAVMIDLATAVEPSLEVVFIDTRYHFPETLATVETIRRRYGLNLKMMTVAPQPEPLWKVDPVNCCAAAKIEQLDRALVGKLAWMSGLRRAEASTRATPTSPATSPTTTCRSTRCAPRAIPRSAANPAPSPSTPAPIPARAAGPAWTRRSAASTSDRGPGGGVARGRRGCGPRPRLRTAPLTGACGGSQPRCSTKRSSCLRLRHSYAPSQYTAYWPTIESPVSQYERGSGLSQYTWRALRAISSSTHACDEW